MSAPLARAHPTPTPTTPTPRPLVLGDSYMPAAVLLDALADAGVAADAVTITRTDAPSWPLDALREYEGDPAEVSTLIAGREVIALHGVPITRGVLEANRQLRLIGCARGGPVNIDLPAAKELGVRVTTTPGKNAAAVADYTIGAIIQTLRNVLPSVRDVDASAAEGRGVAESAFEGARWFGTELEGQTLGLVGLGNVARLVAARATALGMRVTAFDPFVPADAAAAAGVDRVDDLPELLARSRVLSLHARATAENRRMIGAAELAALPAGAVLINSARESLVDEHALLAALRSGHLAGAALDVCEHDGPWRELIRRPGVTLTPHIAGATFETLRRGAGMLAEEITAYRDGRALRWEL